MYQTVVLKSNAYGHGLLECYKILKTEKPEWLAVNYIFEAKSLRDAGFEKRIMIVQLENLHHYK